MLINPEVIEYFTNEMILTKFNTRVDTALAGRYRISGVPQLVMVDRDGNEVDRVVGYRPPDTLLKILEGYKQGIGTLEDLLGRSETETNRPLYAEIADKYRYRGQLDEARIWFGRVIADGEPTDSMSGEARMAMADLLRRADDVDGAVGAYGEVMQDFAGTPFAQDAEIWRAYVLDRHGDTVAAVEAYRGFLEHYPEADDTTFARGQIKKLTTPPEETGKQ